MDWLAAALALIKLTSMVVSWMERATARRDGFNEAVALEMAAMARARAKIAGIDKQIKRLTDDQLARRVAATRRAS